ncbi:MAG: hypothetical protein U1F54_01975 [Burkholderiales bacterium]
MALIAAVATHTVHAAQWAKSYEGLGSPVSVQPTADGGYIAAGNAPPTGGWVAKLDATGEVSWHKAFDGIAVGGAHPAPDGGYIIGGLVLSTQGERNSLLLKLDAGGSVVWQRTYSDSGWDLNFTLEPTADGGYIATGSRRMIEPATAWIMKLDASAGVAWQRILVNPAGDAALTSAHQTVDGGYLVTGAKSSNGGWLVKLDAGGDVVWQKTYGGDSQSAWRGRPTHDGGYILAGSGPLANAALKAWVLRLDVAGNITWQKTYGGVGLSVTVRSIRETGDGGFLMVGGISPSMDGSGAWVVKLDDRGEILWQWAYGISAGISANISVEASDGGYTIAGSASLEDTWMLKLEAGGAIAGCGLMRPSNAKAATTTTSVGSATTVFSVGQASPTEVGVVAGRASAVVPTTHCYSAGPGATVVEYYNAGLDHYFITWMPNEIAYLDAGITTGWARTDHAFKAYSVAQASTSPVCRYYIPPGLGDSHFFGRGTDECNATGQKNPQFVLEDPAFMQMYLPGAGVCPANTTEVYRVFSNRYDANHRYMTSKSLRDQMVAKGWVAEGDGPDLVVMCAPQ